MADPKGTPPAPAKCGPEVQAFDLKALLAMVKALIEALAPFMTYAHAIGCDDHQRLMLSAAGGALDVAQVCIMCAAGCEDANAQKPAK